MNEWTSTTLIELLRGRGAHLDSVACVQGLTVEEAGRTISGYPHSVWHLLWHLNVWMSFELRRIHGERPSYPANAYTWPTNSLPREEDWAEAVDQFERLIDELVMLAESDPGLLRQRVKGYSEENPDVDPYVGALLWQIVAHNSYHVGQIVLLRRSIGAWPPLSTGEAS